jgi:D-proline reductase (dithiol) PrdB
MKPAQAAELQTPLLQRIVDMIQHEIDPDFWFVSPRPIPWRAMTLPVAESRIALVTTGGLHLRTDTQFRALQERLGDTDFRVLPHGTSADEIALDAPYVDQKETARDPEVALPMSVLDSLERDGLIGSPAPRHYSFCGGVVRPYPGLAESATRLATMLHDDQVDAVLLLPTCSLCVQTVCVLSHELEGRGFPTVVISLIPELSSIVGAPRTLVVRFPFGAPCGDPGNRELHRAVVLEALGILTSARKPGHVQESRHAWKRPPRLTSRRLGR